MDVAVGSTNPVKHSAVERALDGHATTVEAVDVDSGVPEQPTGRAETIRGARNRARRALEANGAELGVGIEGGVDTVDGLPYLVMWAAVTDGDRLECGGGPSIRLPEPVVERIRDGEELGPVLDDLLERSDINEQEGAAGVFTGGLTNRENALVQAVAAAAGPFVSDVY